MVCQRWCVTKLCVTMMLWRREAGGGGGEPGIQNQKQKPHTKTWGTSQHIQTRRRMARERRGAGSSLVSMETPYYKTIY